AVVVEAAGFLEGMGEGALRLERTLERVEHHVVFHRGVLPHPGDGRALLDGHSAVLEVHVGDRDHRVGDRLLAGGSLLLAAAGGEDRHRDGDDGDELFHAGLLSIVLWSRSNRAMDRYSPKRAIPSGTWMLRTRPYPMPDCKPSPRNPTTA